MSLLSTLAAHDFGFIRTAELVQRVEATLSTIEDLERFEGHLLNWYDTRTLTPLTPRYVSTVDSGNLAGALMALSEGLRRLAGQTQTAATISSGLADTAELALQYVKQIPDTSAAPHTGVASLDAAVSSIVAALEHPGDAAQQLMRAAELGPNLLRAIAQFETEATISPDQSEAIFWSRALATAVNTPDDDPVGLAPR